MKRLTLSLSLSAASILLLNSCKKNPDTVEITEQRELCKFDESELLRYRFNPFTAIQPLEWRRVPRTEFRKLNYRTGKGTEISVSTASGGVPPNAKRWYGQFGQELPEDFKIDSIYPDAKMFGDRPFYLVEIKGNFQNTMAGMNVVKQNHTCLGILCPTGGGNITTIKMTGPSAEVEAQRENLIKFATQLTTHNTSSNE